MTDYLGRFVWHDAMTSDMKAAETFYKSVIGWTMADAGMAGRPYMLVSAGATMVGGLMPITKEAKDMGARPCWTGYIAVPDVDAYAARVTAAGGAIHRPPEDIPGVGRFSVAADPHKAVFILFKGSSEGGPPSAARGAAGTVGWNELHAGDMASAFSFYAGLFGWTKDEAIDMGPMGIYQIFAANGVPTGGMMTRAPHTPGPFWLYYFNIDAIDSATERVKQAGGKILFGPETVPGGQWIVQCMDPQGAVFGMVAPKR